MLGGGGLQPFVELKKRQIAEVVAVTILVGDTITSSSSELALCLPLLLPFFCLFVVFVNSTDGEDI